jgi:hypothetical protein
MNRLQPEEVQFVTVLTGFPLMEADSPYIVAKWLTFLLRILEVPGLNPAPETSYPVLSVSWF